MGLLDSLTKGVKGYFEKNKEQQEMMDELQREADLHRLQVFKENFRTDSRKVAEAEAKKLSAEKSGLQRLRAVNRTRRLNEQGPEPGSFFERLSSFTEKNKARMQQNLDRTAVMRKTAEEEKASKMQQRIGERSSRMQHTTSLRDRTPTWRM